MTFREILANVVNGTPGALGATLIGADGIAVDEYMIDSDVDASALAVEFQRVLEEARKLARTHLGGSGGGLEELILTTETQQLLFRQVDDEYFVVVVLDRSAILGKARYLVGALLGALRREL